MPRRPGTEYRCGRTLGADEGVVAVPFLVLLVVAVVVVVLVMRAAARRPGAGGRRRRGAPRPRSQQAARPLAPDDDPEFLRELERRTRRDDGSPA